MTGEIEPRLRDKRAPLYLLVTLTACGTLGMHMIIPALPATAASLRVGAGTIQLAITLYLVGLAIGQLIYGPISDRFGRRPVLLVGLGLYTVAGFAAAAAPFAAALITARVFQSLGGCAGMVLGRAIVRDTASADRAAAQLALLTLAMSAVPALAPAIGGYATAWFGWRACFALLAALGGVTLVLTWALLPETLGPRDGGRGARSLLFSYLRLLRSRAFCGYAVGGACKTTSFYAFMSASPFIFEHRLHRGPQEVGMYYLLLMCGVALGGLIANRVAGRIPTRTALRVANGLAITGASAFALADLVGWVSVSTMVAPVALFMVGAGMASPFAVAGAVSVNPLAIGAASGLYGCVQMTYGVLCTVVVEIWQPGAVFPVAAVLLGSTLLGQVALMLAMRGR
ncbi:MAG TPA: multidrug effflux MFS transporter [Acetobacteraceae bacterium]|nr:multidrug effflux MFS transporter [Acetobacteraceae bacterium]